MLRIPLAGGGALEVTNPDLEERVLVAHAEALGQREGQERALSVVYRVSGPADDTLPHGGLLTRRLQMSPRSARQLIVDGRLGYVCIGSEKGYRVTERHVRVFLGELDAA